MDLWLGALTFVSIFLFSLALAAIVGWVRHPIEERLDRFSRNDNGSNKKRPKPRERGTTWFTSFGGKVAPNDPIQKGEGKKRLARAGYYGDTAYFTYWGIKITLTFSLPLVVVFWVVVQNIDGTRSLIPLIFALGLGLFTPDIVLMSQGQKRHKQIFHGLPDALDLLVVCLEAGLGLDAAMRKVSEEFHLTSPVLSEELNLTCNAVRLGQSRGEALHELGARTDHIDLKALVAVLNQADRFGTSMAQALRVHADDMRTRRKQRAEEMAAKTTVKLIFPLVMFIFPAIFVVLGGPAIIRIVKMFTENTL